MNFPLYLLPLDFLPSSPLQNGCEAQRMVWKHTDCPQNTLSWGRSRCGSRIPKGRQAFQSSYDIVEEDKGEWKFQPEVFFTRSRLLTDKWQQIGLRPRVVDSTVPRPKLEHGLDAGTAPWLCASKIYNPTWREEKKLKEIAGGPAWKAKIFLLEFKDLKQPTRVNPESSRTPWICH